MKSITLAAGRGSRLGGLTASSPKTLMTLAGKPLLQWQLEALKAAGVTHSSIITGYCSEALIPYADAHIYNPDWNNTNIFGSLLCAAALLASEPYIVSYGDIVYRADIAGKLMASDAPIAITYDELWLALWEQRFAEPLSDAECFMQHDGWLQQIGSHATSVDEIQGQYMGLLKITPQGWQQISACIKTLPPGKEKQIDMTTLLSLLLSKGVRIAAVPVKGGWIEVDTASDISLYENQLLAGRWTHDWR